ncbi:MAG: hypothetical protein KBT00_02755 [Bacteroidales bacterium]|nr:hypothetical protein [Candidatus Cacconaster merdequi]
MTKKIPILLLCLIGLLPQAIASDGGKPFFRNWSALEYRGHNRNFAVECDGEGRVFVANFEGLVIYDGARWRIIHTPAISRVTSVYPASDGKIWFGGDNLLGYLPTGDSEEAEYIASDLDVKQAFGEVLGIYEKNGVLCFFAADGNDYSVSGNQIALAGARGGNEADSGNSVSEDVPDIGLTVYATVGEGLTVNEKENGTLLYGLTTDDGLCSNTVNDLSYDGRGSVWGATDNGLFVVNLVPVYTHYSATDGLDGQVTCILKNGPLYVGTLQGLFRLDENDRFQPVKEISLACWQLARADDGATTLAATAEGLFSIGSSVKQLTERHTLSVFVESASSVLAGEVNGIYRYYLDGRSEKLADVANVVKFKSYDGAVRAITLGRETYLMNASGSKFAKIDEASDMSLLFEFEGSDGSYWHSDSDNMGLICDNLSDNERLWCEPLSGYNIQAMELNEGQIWVGGSFGLIRMDRERMLSLKPYGNALYVRSSQMEEDYTSFVIAGDKLDPIGSAKYSYRLNDNAEWSRWNESQELSFSHLTPGKYHFSARSMDAYGQIAESEPISFSVPVPFYLSWYALLFYILIIAGGIASFFRIRMIRARQEQARLETLVDERTRELKDAQSQLLRQEREATVGKLTKGLIDRILNPLNYINNFSHLSIGLTKDLQANLEDEKDNMEEDNYEDSMDVLDMMNTNLAKIEVHGVSTTRILKAMEELLKERSGNTESVNLNALCQKDIEVAGKYYADDISSMGIKLELDAPESPITIDLVAEQFNKVIMSMLANSFYAVKKKMDKVGRNAGYTPAVRLSLAGGNGEPVKLSVYDNGIGIEESIQDKIFDPFFTTKPTAEAPGIGLYLGQQIIQDMNGNITVRSVKDEYTEFIITI